MLENWFIELVYLYLEYIGRVDVFTQKKIWQDEENIVTIACANRGVNGGTKF